MWHGRYSKWHADPAWSDSRVDIDAVRDDHEGFRIWLRHHDETLGVLVARFANPLLYVASDESYRIARIEPTQPALEFPHVLWRVADSELVGLFHRQSAGAYESWQIDHYAFIAANEVVDVLSVDPPQLNTAAA